MFTRLGSILICLLAGWLLLTGCAGASTTQVWSLAWLPSQAASHDQPPDTAFRACARAQTPGGALNEPAEIVWLASGRDPLMGLALVQLDAAGQQVALGVVSIDNGADRWQLTDGGGVVRPQPGQGVALHFGLNWSWALPAGSYNSIAIEVPDTPPGGSAQLWVSDKGQDFVLARLFTTISPPAEGQPITLAGQSGWQSNAGRFTIIGLNLTEGIYTGLGTIIFAGTSGLQQSEKLATQAVQHLNDLLPP